MLGGYRLVRKLGSGTRSEVWLGSDGSSTAAIKVYLPTTQATSIDAEIDALGRATSRHVVRLDGLTSGPHGMPCLILQRLRVMNLGRLLADRYPTPGESVTILAPLALALEELHASGVAHRAVGASAVLFDEAGAPVLTGFGSAELFGGLSAEGLAEKPSPALLAKSESVFADLNGMIALTRSALGRVDSEVTRWLDAEEDNCVPHEFLAELADRLFSFATPSPVSLGREVPESHYGAVMPRLGPHLSLASALASPAVAHAEPTRIPVSGPLSLLHFPDSLLEGMRATLAGWFTTGGIAALWQRISALLRPVRTPVWVMAGIVSVAVVAFTAIGSGTARNDPSAAMPNSTPTPSTIRSAPTPHPSVFADDPVPAAKALLSARSECFTDQSVLCLDGVDQSGSAAIEADSYRIRLLQSGAEYDESIDPLSALTQATELIQLTLVERLGDSALLAIDNDVSGSPLPSVTMLIVRGDDGWRIRDLVAADSVVP